MEYINKQYLLDKRPSGMPTDDCWKLNEEKITSIKKNEILIEEEISDSAAKDAPSPETISDVSFGSLIDSVTDFIKS